MPLSDYETTALTALSRLPWPAFEHAVMKAREQLVNLSQDELIYASSTSIALQDFFSMEQCRVLQTQLEGVGYFNQQLVIAFRVAKVLARYKIWQQNDYLDGIHKLSDGSFMIEITSYKVVTEQLSRYSFSLKKLKTYRNLIDALRFCNARDLDALLAKAPPESFRFLWERLRKSLYKTR